MERAFLAFIVGVSFSATFITHTYIAWAFEKGGTAPIGIDMLYIGTRMAYGVANVINVYMGNTVQSSLITGALLGLFLSYVGRFGYDLPIQLFGFNAENEWQVHIIAAILYALIFAILVRNINNLFLGRDLMGRNKSHVII